MEKYHVGRTLGEGSFALVHEAFLKSDGTRVAIKKIKEKQKSWEKCLSLRELRSLKSMGKHRNLVLLRELVLAKENLYFVFEFLPHNLHQLIQGAAADGGFDLAHAAAMAGGLLSGVAHMHSRCAHREKRVPSLYGCLPSDAACACCAGQRLHAPRPEAWVSALEGPHLLIHVLPLLRRRPCQPTRDPDPNPSWRSREYLVRRKGPRPEDSGPRACARDPVAAAVHRVRGDAMVPCARARPRLDHLYADGKRP